MNGHFGEAGRQYVFSGPGLGQMGSYLLPLCPVEVPAEGIGALFTEVADPVPIYLAIPGLLCVSALFLYYAARKIRSMEISYGTG